ncbi:MAG: tyrosine--tRNA ligase [Deltaproteobacteria bacterium]|nr:tyrosine--tRNA ligase [Deltaproteobacteria bacterium]
MSNAFDILKERGFIYQVTDEENLRKHLNRSSKFYIGFDPTADSLHVGSLEPIMAMVHMQRQGHVPIVVVGGGTGMIGDPSGKTEARKLLSDDKLKENKLGIKNQLAHYLDFEDDRAIMVDNAEWLVSLNYIEFLRDIGVNFSVNRMLTTESIKLRLESTSGLSFLEFNYQLLQAYDFYILARDRDCLVQMGGQDQWGNIVAGIDLIRRKLGKQAYGATFPLLLNSSGTKFGKTEAGTIWLDKKRTSPYELYQFFRNMDDRDLKRNLSLFTLLPMEEVNRLSSLEGNAINRAKEILGFEVVCMCHGEESAREAYAASIEQFGPADPNGTVATSSRIVSSGIRQGEQGLPATKIAEVALNGSGKPLTELLVDTGLCKSKSEARRLIRSNSVAVNQEKIRDEMRTVTMSDVIGGRILISVGKKRLHRVIPV